MRLVKGDISELINRKKLTKTKFQWQEGYGAFSNSYSQINDVVKYITNQKEHHHKKTFLEEYNTMLKAYAVAYNESYIFHEPLQELMVG